MTVVDAIQQIRRSSPKSEDAARQFLSSLPTSVQQQLIAAVYLGREHLHANSLRDDVDLSVGYTDHILESDYARILYEKSSSLDTYLGKLQDLAHAEKFDLTKL